MTEEPREPGGSGPISAARRHVILAGSCCLTAAAAAALEPRRDLPDLAPRGLEALIPQHLGDRRAELASGVVPEQIEGRPLYERTLTRVYVGIDKPAVEVVVAYHTSRSADLKTHRPETCYRVAGFVVDQLQPAVLRFQDRRIPCVRFRGRQADRTDWVLYWTRVAAAYPRTLDEERRAIIRSALGGLKADGLLVRLSLRGDQPELSLERLSGFAGDLLTGCGDAARRLLIG